MAEPSLLDPLPFADFPQFDPSDISFSDPDLFPSDDLLLPDGITSDLDLDDFDLDFSVDDLLLPSSEENSNGSNSTPNPIPDTNLRSPDSGESYAASAVDVHQEVRKQLKRKLDDANRVGTPNPISCKSEEGEEKRNIRLLRNRESAHLSRQRKKQYVEELEEKVRVMNSAIADLNGKISFFMAENARLQQQLNGNAGKGSGNSPTPPPPQYHFPWVPFSGYPMRSNGPPVGYVPIPRLKIQQPKKAESKKSERRTKKVASVSLFGLFFIMMVLGGLMNFGFGGNGDKVNGGGNGRIFNVKGRGGSFNNTEEFREFSRNMRFSDKVYQKGTEGSVHQQNSSDSLPALLYVPRNGKHVEINGNLIIHSVLASEKAMAQAKSNGQGEHQLRREGAGLVIPSHVASPLALPNSAMDVGRHAKAYRNSDGQLRALTSDSHNSYSENKSTMTDGLLHQWFREGLAGPILSSGTCTEVFQFEVSPSAVNPSGGIIPGTSVVNATDKLPLGKIRNRRILYGQSTSNGTALNNTEHFGKPTDCSAPSYGNKSVPSMVVSVLADPREAGDSDSDGMITPKSLSRIFVVVLVDSVKYVTYSCVLPLKNLGPRLVS